MFTVWTEHTGESRILAMGVPTQRAAERLAQIVAELYGDETATVEED